MDIDDVYGIHRKLLDNLIEKEIEKKKISEYLSNLGGNTNLFNFPDNNLRSDVHFLFKKEKEVDKEIKKCRENLEEWIKFYREKKESQYNFVIQHLFQEKEQKDK